MALAALFPSVRSLRHISAASFCNKALSIPPAIKHASWEIPQKLANGKTIYKWRIFQPCLTEEIRRISLKEQLPEVIRNASRCRCGSSTISSSDSALGSADRPDSRTRNQKDRSVQLVHQAFCNSIKDSIHQVRLARACLYRQCV